MSILDLLYKGGKRVFSPKTQARNIASGKQVVSPTTQARNMATATATKEAMATSRQAVDQLITKGQIPLERREEIMRILMAEIAENLKNAAMPVDPNALAQATLAKVLVSLGIGGVVGYGIAENKAENEALQQMEEETQIVLLKVILKM